MTNFQVFDPLIVDLNMYRYCIALYITGTAIYILQLGIVMSNYSRIVRGNTMYLKIPLKSVLECLLFVPIRELRCIASYTIWACSFSSCYHASVCGTFEIVKECISALIVSRI